MDNKDTPIDVPLQPPILERQTTRKTDIPTPANTPTTKRKTNKWVDHVRATAAKKGITYKQAMSVAKQTYNQ